jgi:excisionase family DNA binding protein
MASTIVAGRGNGGNGHVNGHTFWTVSRVSEFLGLCKTTTRELIDSGQIESYRTLGNQRRISVRSVYQYAGFDLEEENDGRGCSSDVAVYCRVSSESQDQKGSLSRQLERVLNETSQREGVDQSDIEVFTDVASSFGSREGLNGLVDRIVDGGVRIVYVEFQDRLSRVPALTRLLEHICNRFNVKLVFLQIEDTDPDSLQSAMKELLDYCQVVANRVSAAKSRLVIQKNLEQETIDRIIELRMAGENTQAIYEILKKEGHIARTKSGRESHVSYNKIRQTIQSQGSITNTSPKFMAAARKLGQKIQTPFESFCDAHLHVVPEGNYDPKKDRTTWNEIYKAYQTYCSRKGVKVMHKKVVAQRLPAEIKKRRLRSMQKSFYLGVEIV